MTSRPASAVPDRMGLDVPVAPVAAREGRPLPRRRSAVRVGPATGCVARNERTRSDDLCHHHDRGSACRLP